VKQWQQKVFGIVLFIAAIFLILANFEESSYAFSFLFELIQPVIVAGVLAFFLHIPMNPAKTCQTSPQGTVLEYH